MTGVTFRKSADTELFDCLASRQRRAVLAVLNETSGDVPESDLAARVAATLRDGEPSAVSEEERREVRIALHHRDLPKLTETGLVDRDPETDCLSLTAHPAHSDPGIQASIEFPQPHEGLDALFEVLADERRQLTLSILSGLHHPIDVKETAALVAAAERETSQQDLPESLVERVHVSLRHAHLPKLVDAGLVAHDRDDGTVTYEGHPALRSAWLESRVVRYAADA